MQEIDKLINVILKKVVVFRYAVIDTNLAYKHLRHYIQIYVGENHESVHLNYAPPKHWPHTANNSWYKVRVSFLAKIALDFGLTISFLQICKCVGIKELISRCYNLSSYIIKILR